MKRGNFLRGADFFMGGAGEGRILRSYYQSRSDCTRPQAVMRVDAGGGSPLPLIGGPGVLPPEKILICECPYVHFRVLKRHIF